jgi:membrane protein DedA with SNARE-associated domain
MIGRPRESITGVTTDALNRWPGLARRAPQLEPMLERWHAAAIIGVRFAYGLCVAGRVLMGMSSLPAWRFALYNALGALLWALVIGGLGWGFGEAATRVLGEIRHLEGWLLAALGLSGVVWWALASLRRRRTGRSA